MKLQLRRTLKELGVPDAWISTEYEELMAAAQVRHAELLVLLRHLEATNPEVWCNMPWSKARAEWEKNEGYKNEPCTDPRIVNTDGRTLGNLRISFKAIYYRPDHEYLWWPKRNKRRTERYRLARQEKLKKL